MTLDIHQVMSGLFEVSLMLHSEEIPVRLSLADAEGASQQSSEDGVQANRISTLTIVPDLSTLATGSSLWRTVTPG